MRFGSRQRLAQQESLRLLAFELLEEQQLRQTFHPLRRNVDSQGARHRDDCSRDSAIIPTIIDVCDERPIYLEAIDREISQAAEARVPGTEVIDCQTDTDGLQYTQSLLRPTLIRHDDGLGDLQLELSWLQTGLSQYCRDL